MTVPRLPVPLRPAFCHAGNACSSCSAVSVSADRTLTNQLDGATEKHNDASSDNLRQASVVALDGRSANDNATDVGSLIECVNSTKLRSSTDEASSEAIARSVNILCACDSRSTPERSTRRSAEALALQERKRQRSFASLSDNATETATALHVPRHHEAGSRAGATEADARHSTGPGRGEPCRSPRLPVAYRRQSAWAGEWAQSCGDPPPPSRQHFDVWNFGTATDDAGTGSFALDVEHVEVTA